MQRIHSRDLKTLKRRLRFVESEQYKNTWSIAEEGALKRVLPWVEYLIDHPWIMTSLMGQATEEKITEGE